jgi:hypothetical protein
LNLYRRIFNPEKRAFLRKAFLKSFLQGVTLIFGHIRYSEWPCPSDYGRVTARFFTVNDVRSSVYTLDKKRYDYRTKENFLNLKRVSRIETNSTPFGGLWKICETFFRVSNSFQKRFRMLPFFSVYGTTAYGRNTTLVKRVMSGSFTFIIIPFLNINENGRLWLLTIVVNIDLGMIGNIIWIT